MSDDSYAAIPWELRRARAVANFVADAMPALETLRILGDPYRMHAEAELREIVALARGASQDKMASMSVTMCAFICALEGGIVRCLSTEFTRETPVQKGL